MSKELDYIGPIISSLAQVRLVPQANIATPGVYHASVQDVLDEGIRSTFGMREKDAIILRMAADLVLVGELAVTADELRRQVKGLQLENGRLRKQLERTE